MPHKMLSQTLRSRVDDAEVDFESSLPGFRLTHILNVASGPDLDVVAQVLACVKCEQMSISGWTIARRGEVLDQRISLQAISELRVRCLREQLLRLDLGLRIRLEHQFKRQRPNDVELLR